MKRYFYILLLLTYITAPAFSQEIPFDYQRDFRMILAKTQDKSSDLSYQKLLIRFLDNDSSLTNSETLALMIGYTEDKNYKPFKDMQTEKEIFDLNESGDYQTALDESKIFLQKHPLSLRILKERSYAYHQLRKKDSADYYMNLVEKIMNAMIYSGKGKKIEQAIFSLGLNDGEHFINNIGMTPSKQNTVWDKNKNFIFVVDAITKEDVHINFYFNIQHAKLKADDEGVDEETPLEKSKKKKKGKPAGPVAKPANDSLEIAPTPANPK